MITISVNTHAFPPASKQQSISQRGDETATLEGGRQSGWLADKVERFASKKLLGNVEEGERVLNRIMDGFEAACHGQQSANCRVNYLCSLLVRSLLLALLCTPSPCRPVPNGSAVARAASAPLLPSLLSRDVRGARSKMLPSARPRAELPGLPFAAVQAEVINVERARNARRAWSDASRKASARPDALRPRSSHVGRMCYYYSDMNRRIL